MKSKQRQDTAVPVVGQPTTTEQNALTEDTAAEGALVLGESAVAADADISEESAAVAEAVPLTLEKPAAEAEPNSVDDDGAVLVVKKLNKHFGALHVLKDVDFTMKKGEVVAIIGQSGGGKSTFLRAITFLEKIQSGEITINGDKIVTCVNGKSLYPKEEELRKRALKVGLVFQDFNLFPHLSVLSNLTLALRLVDGRTKEDAKTRGKELLEKVGLTDKIAAYPFELSGGQKQRVAIARALAMEPELLCFDEPTSALDPELTGEVLKVIRDLKLKLHSTMLIVTHEMGFAKSVADRIVFIDGGCILENGTPDEVFNHPKNARTREFLSKMCEE